MDGTSDIARLEAKVDKLQHTLDLILKFVIWTVVASAVLMILPLIAIAFVLPGLVSTYSSLLQ